MSVTTRTNRATNPAVAAAITNWAVVAGTGGTATTVRNTGDGMFRPGFARTAWTVATSAVSGGFTYTQSSGIPASTAQAFQVWVISSKTQRLQLTVACKNSGGTTVNTITGTAVVVPANTLTAVQAQGTSGALVTQAVLTVAAVSGTSGTNWANGDTLDGMGVLIENGTTYGDYFDGEMPDGGSIVYAWTGTADASTSTAVTYVPTITLTSHTDSPCPRVDITIADLDPNDDVVNVWRTAEGKRRAVRNGRHRTIVGSDAITDYEVPLGRDVMYEVEVLSGICAQAVVAPANVTINATSGWIQDPLDPTGAVPLYADYGPNGEPSLRVDAIKSFEYASGINLIPILGDDEPVALIGQAMAASNVPFHMITDAAQQATTLRNLLKQAAPVLIRPLPGWASGLPGLCYVAFDKPKEMPLDEQYGGQIIEWELKGTLVKPSNITVVVALFTYETVAALWSTYQSAQTTYSGNGRSYLDTKKNPNN